VFASARASSSQGSCQPMVRLLGDPPGAEGRHPLPGRGPRALQGYRELPVVVEHADGLVPQRGSDQPAREVIHDAHALEQPVALELVPDQGPFPDQRELQAPGTAGGSEEALELRERGGARALQEQIAEVRRISPIRDGRESRRRRWRGRSRWTPGAQRVDPLGSRLRRAVDPQQSLHVRVVSHGSPPRSAIAAAAPARSGGGSRPSGRTPHGAVLVSGSDCPRGTTAVRNASISGRPCPSMTDYQS